MQDNPKSSYRIFIDMIKNYFMEHHHLKEQEAEEKAIRIGNYYKSRIGTEKRKDVSSIKKKTKAP